MSFDRWFDKPHRPTRDIDLLGFGPAVLDHLAPVFQAICGQYCDDGIEFDQVSVRAVEIRKDANYTGNVRHCAELRLFKCHHRSRVSLGERTPTPDVVEHYRRPMID